MTTTNNMGLILPDPSVTLGPTWAALLNAALAQVDTHDHSSGKGVKITPAGFNFAANLPCNGYELQDVGGLVLRSLTVDKTVAGSVYCKNGELFWVSAGGAAVQITSGTGLNLASTGTIGGDYGGVGVTASATYSNALKTFSWLQDAGIGAKMFCADILLTFPGSSQNSVTLKAQSGSAAYSYSWPLAAPVANDSIMCATTGGINSFKVVTGTANQVTVTSSATALTLSLPQNIHTGASPTFTGMNLSGLTASRAVVTDGSKNLASLQYTSAATANTLVSRDGSGDSTFNTLTLSGLTASRAVVTNGSKVLASLAYDTAPSAGSLVQRDGSGATNFTGLNVSGLTASYAVVTDGSKNLASLQYTSSAVAGSLVQRDGSGNIAVNRLTAETGVIAGNGNVQFLVKKYTATFTAGTNVTNITHGLTSSKILSIAAMVGGYVAPGRELGGHAASAPHIYTVRYNSTEIVIQSLIDDAGGTAANLLSNQSIVVLVTYES